MTASLRATAIFALLKPVPLAIRRPPRASGRRVELLARAAVKAAEAIYVVILFLLPMWWLDPLFGYTPASAPFLRNAFFDDRSTCFCVGMIIQQLLGLGARQL
jgi:hypothetical protein